MIPRMVLIQMDNGEVIAVGPVGKDETIEALRALAERHGHEPYGQARRLSAEQFRELLRQDGEPS